MNKRSKKKQGLLNQAEPSHNVPDELIIKIKEVVKSYLIEGEMEDFIPKEKIDVRARLNWKNESIILVEVENGRMIESNDSPNYHGNLIAKDIIDEVKEVEFVGFDCKYHVELEFKLKK
jgi:hypothetical protein